MGGFFCLGLKSQVLISVVPMALGRPHQSAIGTVDILTMEFIPSRFPSP